MIISCPTLKYSDVITRIKSVYLSNLLSFSMHDYHLPGKWFFLIPKLEFPDPLRHYKLIALKIMTSEFPNSSLERENNFTFNLQKFAATFATENFENY